jgi:long-chain acyl-CoA synthetase
VSQQFQSLIAWKVCIGDDDWMNVATNPQTIAAFFARTTAARADEPALGFIRGGELQWRMWREVADNAATLVAAIQAGGIVPGDRVAHVSENRYEWIITDLAMHLAGAVHVPIHVTLSAKQIAEQIIDCGAKLVFASSREMAAKFADRMDDRVPILIHDDFQSLVNKSSARYADKPQAASGGDELATILYTSGTTGRPRGVMLSHRNLATNTAAVCEAHEVNTDHTLLCILPLSHIYARTCDLYTWVCRGSRLVLAESRETLRRDCELVRPSALNAVPFVFQRIMEGVRKNSAGDESAALRAAFGGRIEMLFSGGAPLAPDVETWYAEHGLPILAGYGMTEASPVVAVSMRQARRAGTVGQVLRGVEVRITDDGEILVRGPNVMLGYWRDEAATAAVIRDGWLHTGDLGELDDQGFLSICGRKKELIVLSTGKKVSPTRVEALLTASPLIEQAVVFGDGRCGLVALIVPTACGKAGNEESSTAYRASSETYKAEVCRCLAAAAHEEQVHKFVLIDRPFSIERGELTAKMSLNRTVIARNFAEEIAALDSDKAGVAADVKTTAAVAADC